MAKTGYFPSVREPTKLQTKIRDFIAAFIADNGKSPNASQIQHHFSFRSKASVLNHLLWMEKKQMIYRIRFPGLPSDITLTTPQNIDRCPHCRYPLPSG